MRITFKNVAVGTTADGKKVICLRERVGIKGDCRYYVVVDAVPTGSSYLDLIDASIEFSKKFLV